MSMLSYLICVSSHLLTQIQAINLFISSADELFGPITSLRCGDSPTWHIPWTAFALKPLDWERVNTICCIIADANVIQQYFLHETKTTLWHVIPAFEELQTAWEAKRKLPEFQPYKAALDHGLNKLGKYYGKFDDKPVYVLALGKYLHTHLNLVTNYNYSSSSILQTCIHQDGMGWTSGTTEG